MSKRKLPGILYIVLVGLLFTSCYELSQANRYLQIISGGIGLDTLPTTPGIDPSYIALATKAREIRRFAIHNLGLKNTSNYTRLVILPKDTNRPARFSGLATVVQACAELSFTRWYWDYPFVGKLPYRGYFNHAEAVQENERLTKLGQDTLLRPVDAFSTLGFLPDPLFSFMANYDEAELADLIIHEMTHATIFIKGSGTKESFSQFNEEVATFIGRRGSMLYLEASGKEQELETLTLHQTDRKTFARFMAETARLLDRVYTSNLPDTQKRAKKAEIIADRAEVYTRLYDTIFRTKNYKSYPMNKLNNAWFDLYRLYEGEDALYDDFLKQYCNNNLQTFITVIKDLANNRGNPKEAMKNLMQKEPPWDQI